MRFALSRCLAAPFWVLLLSKYYASPFLRTERSKANVYSPFNPSTCMFLLFSFPLYRSSLVPHFPPPPTLYCSAWLAAYPPEGNGREVGLEAYFLKANSRFPYSVEAVLAFFCHWKKKKILIILCLTYCWNVAGCLARHAGGVDQTVQVYRGSPPGWLVLLIIVLRIQTCLADPDNTFQFSFSYLWSRIC